jgi:NADPH2:quinone reductase
MHAVVCSRHGGPEVMRYQEVDRPDPGPGEVLVRAEAVGVNYVDVMRRSGRHPTAPPPPFIPGIELCGRVAALGPGVTRFREGDRVIGRCVSHGAYAEFVRVEERFAVNCPEGLSAEEAAALFVNGQTAYHALITVGRARPGEAVLITAAAGGVGVCLVQVAKRLGARVLAAAGGPAKLEVARSLGADGLIDYTREDWPEAVLGATEGRGADLILESVGGDIFAGCLACWAPRGRLVVYGKASGRPGLIGGDDLLFGSRTAHGLAVGMVIEDTELLAASMRELFGWMADGSLRMVIGRTFPLREAAEAHRHLESRSSHGKIVLIP